jgi:hypothetical protein
MYKSIQKYQEFLKKQELEKETQLSNTSESVNEQMTKFMSKHGWERKGKGQKVKFTKKFNGKDVIVEFRCKYGSEDPGGLPEFVHDNSIPNSIEKIQMGYFHWNDQNTSGWSLDVVMERMEVFYNNYTS